MPTNLRGTLFLCRRCDARMYIDLNDPSVQIECPRCKGDILYKPRRPNNTIQTEAR